MFNDLTYNERCEIFGGDTTSSLHLEDQARREEQIIEDQDAIEARGGPGYYFPVLNDFPF